MSNVITGYVTTRGAAVYTDYSYDHFRRLAKKFNIPRYGNHKNRFYVPDLERWMSNPNCFVGMQSTVNAVRKVKLIPIKGVTQ